jgi:hypothetical protein
LWRRREDINQTKVYRFRDVTRRYINERTLKLLQLARANSYGFQTIRPMHKIWFEFS